MTGRARRSTPSAGPVRSILRFWRLVPLTAALIVVATLLVHEARPAEAQETTTVWSATLRARTIMTDVFGCWNGSSFIQWRCSRTVSLTEDEFTHEGMSHSIRKITLNVRTGALELVLDRAFPQEIRTAATLNVGGSRLSLSSAAFSNGNRTATWSSTGLDWSSGDRVQLSLTMPVSEESGNSILLSASPATLPRGGGREVTVSLRAPAPRDLRVVITPSGTVDYELSAPHGETAGFSFPEGATNPGNADQPGTFTISASRSAAVGETIVLTPATVTPGLTGTPLTLTIEAGGL